ncbi:hypothetical protein HELRODRAFT_188719 [Helobdella robusta]|uniref:Neural proliferation differentiation and control protein 1 n=1 Tax=Helobdella robusta TaxID=6412 RepID=T1FQA6_HELRO|nr:hypothetical protein HELRODRAFT_188719 [Helobdella robusta]ESO02476.1 hypothetical protein HELRODRAFT_188719 [Helobdella robusta]
MRTISSSSSSVLSPKGFVNHDVIGLKKSDYDDVRYLRQDNNERSILDRYWDIILIGVLSSISLVLIIAIVITIVCMCRSKRVQEQEVPYQTFYGDQRAPVGPANGDRKLAYSAQMYHYQYQKQQMLANEKGNDYDNKNGSGNSTDEEVIDDDDTVYECPGLANTEEEMEVTNPHFVETPMAQPTTAAAAAATSSATFSSAGGGAGVSGFKSSTDGNNNSSPYRHQLQHHQHAKLPHHHQ